MIEQGETATASKSSVERAAGGSRQVEASAPKALLLRVGIDRGTGGALGPIFRDGSFEYVPIPEAVPTRFPLTYATLPGRHVPSLASVLPARLAGCHPHVDPDFATRSYGDAAPRKRRQLLRLAPGDLLVFYGGLAPVGGEDRPRLFAIGSLRVRQVHHLRPRDIGRGDLQEKFGQTAHFLRRIRDPELALVEGEADASGLFARAIPLADGRDCLLRDLTSWGYQGSLLRSVGHWIRGSRSLQSLDAWLRHGPASLVTGNTRLTATASSALRPAERGADLVIDDPRPREGDWVIVLAESGGGGPRAFARINRIAYANGMRSAFSSLYWFFESPRSAPFDAFLGPGSSLRGRSDGSSIRRQVAWLSHHYRIGFHFVSEPEADPARPCCRGKTARSRPQVA
jgi:hypothetical protein